MTAVDEIDAVAADWRPWRVDDRRVVLAAVEQVAAECDGLVHIADVRERLAREVDPHTIGAVICALVRQRVLVDTGATRPNGGHRSRNRTKPAAVRRLMGPLPAA